MPPYLIVFSLSLLLLLSFATALRFPIHTWDHVPVFVHTSQQATSVFSRADTAILSRYAAITIEKWQGCATLVTQQEGVLAAAKGLRTAQPNLTIYAWLDTMRIYSNKTWNPHIRDLSNQSCVRPAGTPFLETHPTPYELHAANGALALDPYLSAHVYDHTQPIVRQFWQEYCTNLTDTGLIDGCGADASGQPASYIPNLSAATAAAWEVGRQKTMLSTVSALSSIGGVLLGKEGWQLGTDTNGVLQEQCTASNATIFTLQNATAAAQASGQRYVYECHCGGTMNELAAFLIGAGPDHFWGFGPWLTWNGGYEDDWLPEFDKPLGAPLSDGVYSVATGNWTRSFSTGTKVTFNAQRGAGDIMWSSAVPSRVWPKAV